MSYELWAIDAESGEAVLREGQRWFILSFDYDWKPIQMKGEADAIKWAISGSAVLVGIVYAKISEVVDDIRRVCLAALEEDEPLSPESVFLLLRGVGIDRSTPEGLRDRGATWEREIVRIYSRRLDRYFESKGLSPAEVVEFRCETLRRVSEGGSSARGVDLKRLVFELARHVYADRGGRLNQRREDERHPEVLNLWWLPTYQEAEWGRIVGDLSEEDLLCLSVWSGPQTNYSYEEVAIGLHLPVQRVRESLGRVADLVGCSPEDLRDSSLREACLQAIQR